MFKDPCERPHPPPPVHLPHDPFPPPLPPACGLSIASSRRLSLFRRFGAALGICVQSSLTVCPLLCAVSGSAVLAHTPKAAEHGARGLLPPGNGYGECEAEATNTGADSGWREGGGCVPSERRARAADDACDILSGSPVPVLNTLVCRVCVSPSNGIRYICVYLYVRYLSFHGSRAAAAAARGGARPAHSPHTRRTRPQTRRDAPATRDAHRPAARQRAPPGPAPGHPTGTPRHATFRQPSRAERPGTPPETGPRPDRSIAQFLKSCRAAHIQRTIYYLHNASNRFTLGKPTRQ